MPNRPSGAEGGAPPSLISKGVRLVGELESEGELQLDGSFEGHVRCHQLTIGESGSLSGDVEAEVAVIKGRFSGQIKARSVRVAETATIEGDIWQDNISIESGARVNARLLLRGEAKPAVLTGDHPNEKAGKPEDPAGEREVVGLSA